MQPHLKVLSLKPQQMEHMMFHHPTGQTPELVKWSGEVLLHCLWCNRPGQCSGGCGRCHFFNQCQVLKQGFRRVGWIVCKVVPNWDPVVCPTPLGNQVFWSGSW